ncbi:MAG: YifB family Mg chelatase-like AAA ATPase, partial [Candidatus Thiodiazotropha sp.]
MSLAILHSRAQAGINAPPVVVEVHLANGLPGLSIVGLPEMAVRESKDRVRGALTNSQFDFPTRRITINLAPADLPKEGGRFDLPIALGILAASGQLSQTALASYEFAGELALSGELRPVSGILPAALAARGAGRTLIIPEQNAHEAALVSDLSCHAASHLLAVCRHINGIERLDALQKNNHHPTPSTPADLADVKGQHQARRALEVAAAGGHALIFIGPPGTGKSMLASRLPGILPPMSDEEALESAAIASIANRSFDPRHWQQRPFRAPHHTASAVALVGGGGKPRPGEISLAHNGVLFLDELPEFDRSVLEVLREPMETGRVTISRAAQVAEYPARFQLIAAMNPCPCGYLGDGSARCRCSAEQVHRYRNRLSGPLLDRIDLHVEVPRQPPCASPSDTSLAESTTQVAHRVKQATERQLARQGRRNHALEVKQLEQHAPPDNAARQLLHQAIERLGLSMRAYHRILKVARTIADLQGS